MIFDILCDGNRWYWDGLLVCDMNMINRLIYYLAKVSIVLLLINLIY